MYLTRFVVRGTRSFPLDMLRYDACFPFRTDDVVEIEASHLAEDRDLRRLTDEQFDVTLVQYHDKKIDSHVTSGRWSSFGWTVMEQTTEKR